jgi:EmrB/QacA subfamily drug resistance transporter
MIFGNWKKFSALIPAVALNFMDQTILPVALPSIQAEMNGTSTELQWCVNAYLLAISVFVLVSGKLNDRIGHKKALMIGMAGFVFFSLLCGMSQSIWMLIAARALQGVSAAFMFPAQTAMVAHIFPAEQRGRATGMIVSTGSIFLISAPMVGGYLIEVASWHWIFWINLPIGLLGLWMIYRFLPVTEKTQNKIDSLGFCFFSLSVSSLTLIFMQAASWGWASPSILILAITFLISSALLIWQEKRGDHPFLDLTLFRTPLYAAINLNVTTIQFFLMISVFRIIYIQEILNYSPFETGTIMFITSSPTLFVAPIAGYLSDHFRPKLPVALGYSLLIISTLWLALFPTPSFLSLNTALFLFGLGCPLIFTPSYSSAIASVPREKAGSAMGMITTLRMIGGTIGLALIHLFVTVVQERKTPFEGAQAATIDSFSAVHFALAIFLGLAFVLAMTLHSRKAAY